MDFFDPPPQTSFVWGDRGVLSAGTATSLQALEVPAPRPKASVCLRVNISISL